MMGGQRYGPTKSHQLPHGLDPDLDLLMTSESPQIQEIRLYRELNRELEKSSTDCLRYVDSDIYLKTRQRSPDASQELEEVQSTTVNVGGLLSPQSISKAQSKLNNDFNKKSAAKRGKEEDIIMDYSEQSNCRANNITGALVLGGNCQVCLIKGLKDDLTNITRVIQEKNEQLTSKLKDKRKRSFFERQMNE